MPKRRTTRDSSELSLGSSSDSPQKRAKQDETNESDVEVIDSADTIPGELSKSVENNANDGLLRHPAYYFEDGNIIFRVQNTLFKVHISLLKLQSNDFETVFGIPQVATGTEPSQSQGAPDQNPITLPDILVRQFCNLMTLIYHPFSHKHLLNPPGVSASKGDIAISFAFYFDIATLSHRFAMGDIEQWARPHLEQILRASGKRIAGGLDDALGEDLDHGNNSGVQDNPGGRYKRIAEETGKLNEFCAFRLVEAISYARIISNTRMFNDCLSILQFYCNVEPLAKDEPCLQLLLIGLFKMTSLRESDPALFGSLFLVLLHKGNKLWSHDLFTHMDRMAFFSAQSYLTPLPDSLKTSAPLLFTKPVSSKALIKFFSDNATNYTCTERQCRLDTFLSWQKNFDGQYYNRINSKEFVVSTKALTSLPSRRLDFSYQVRRIKCSRECYEVVLLQLDEMIQRIHAHLGEYYKGFD
ncbi:unnamed protein product [Rhizoctonia solani]|uniref:BTB domain-containing protein n=1 Tax=Rhizoctonia solani TaxID=456999 RepID=A0A8H3H999_9AGAM|nr:unnamed protein product [Rhizoctonia solani]